MKTVPLTAYSRARTRGPAAKRLRGEGRVPAVIYGRKVEPQNLEVKRKDIEDLTHHAASENLLLDLSIEGDGRSKRLVLVKDIQHHPMSRAPLHVDLQEVSETEKVTVMVPVETIGEAAGVKVGGGVLEHVLFKIKVRALPRDLPEVIHVDVSALNIGQTLHLGDIKAPENVEIIGDKGLSVISVAEPITEAQETAALEAGATGTAEVEMTKEKKEEGAPAEGKAGEKAPAGKAGEKAPAAKPGEKAPAAKAGEKPATGKAPAAKGAEKEKKAEKK